MFRQIKEMKAMLEGAPEMAGPALPVSAPAQRLATAQAAVRQARASGTRTGYADGGYARAEDTDEAIAGVSLEQYAAISKHAAAFGHDPAKMAEFAAARGFSELAWRAAVAGWNARLRADAAVARRFNLRYREG
jgi:hypothetical protein